MAKGKNRKWWIIGGVLLTILIIASVYRSKNSQRGVEVEFGEVKKRNIVETISASGKVFPEKEVKISSDVSGEIIELYVIEGDSVKKGQVLLKIDPDAYVSAVARGRATLNDAKAQKAVNESNVQSNHAQVEQVKVQLDNAKKIHDRNKTLFTSGAISQADLDASQANVDQLASNLRAAKANVAAAKKNVEGASYRIKSAAASLQELTTNLNRTTISSPIDGVVSMLNVEAGERVVGTMQMTGTEIMRIANMNAMEVQVEVSENDILNVKEGDEAEIEVDAFSERVFKGIVTEVANSASTIGTGGQVVLTSDQVTNFVVKIRIHSESYADLIQKIGRNPFRPGMTASVDIVTNEIENVLSLPIQAVTAKEEEEEKDEFFEVVFEKNADTVIMRRVKTGIQDDEYIQIKEGLAEGATIVIGPYSAVAKKLDEGDRVKEKEEDEEDDE